MGIYDEQQQNISFNKKLLSEWLYFVDLSASFKKNIMAGQGDVDLNMEYLVQLGKLWNELVVFVKEGTEEDKAFEKRFMKFAKYADFPILLLLGGDEDSIFEMERVVREAMSRKKITVL